MKRPNTIITATPPTPNGDLHVGHLSGPYLGADVYNRYTKLRGGRSLYVSFSDHNQTYVVTTAKKMGRDANELADDYADKIRETLKLAGIEADTFHNPDAGHVRFVQDFFLHLHKTGKIISKKKTVLVDQASGAMVFESYLSGHCKVCFAETAGAICESCGHPNDASSIKLPKSQLNPDGKPEGRKIYEAVAKLVRKELDLVVLELESYRTQIQDFFRGKQGKWRPHLLQLVDEMLARPLPDYPITYVSDWGIPAPFDGHQGQVLNVWAEMYPGLVYGTEMAAKKGGGGGADAHTLWARESKPEIVQFLGYDNSFFFAFVHLALSFADGSHCQPSYIVTNEFYEYENFKFSTSKRNLIWGRDLLAETPRDHVRYFLALSNPEYQKVNFTRPAMDKLLDARLISPWKKLCDSLHAKGRLSQVSAGDPIKLHESDIASLLEILERFERFYGVENFSPQRVAEHISSLLVYAEHYLEYEDTSAEMSADRKIAYVYAMLASVLPTIFMPLLPDTANKIRKSLEMPQIDAWDIRAELATLDWRYSVSLADLIL